MNYPVSIDCRIKRIDTGPILASPVYNQDSLVEYRVEYKAEYK
jgi:hypothetical protein